MTVAEPRTVALAFVERINAGDVDGLAALMTEDHEFIDIPGESNRGRDVMRRGWVGYLRMFPDYRIDVKRVVDRGDTVILVGRSDGTLSPFGRETLRRADGSLPSPEELQGPAIWSAVVRGGLVAQWRVYADTPDVRQELEV